MVESISGEVTAAASVSEAPAQAEATSAAPSEETENSKDEFTDKFLRLTRRERALQQEAQQLKAEKARIEAERKELDEFRARKAKLKEDPLDALNYLGVSFDEITQSILKSGREPTADERVEALEKKLQEMEQRKAKEQEDLINAEREKTVSVFRTNLEKFVEASDYELVKANKAYDYVFEIMQAHYEETERTKGKGELPSFDTACKWAEEEFEEKLEQLLKLNKVQTKLSSRQEKSESPAEVNTPRVSGPSTLTNAMKAVSEPATPSSRRPSDRELFERSAAMIKFT